MPLSSVRLGYFVCQEESQSDLIVGLDILADCVIKPSNDSSQVVLIDRWIAEAQQNIKNFTHISNTAYDLSLWAGVF